MPQDFDDEAAEAPSRACDLSSEAARLRALDRYQILDTPREEEFDSLAMLAAEICGTPIAVVNLIGDGRQFFKAEVGLGLRETPLESSFCRQALLQKDFLYVPDATQDPRFSCNPLVTGSPGLRFYAGALLKTPEGLVLGTLCVLDTTPRRLSERQQASLRHLARQTMVQLELRRTVREQRAERELQDRILDSATDYAIVATDRHGRVTRWNEGAARIMGWTEAEMLGQPVHAFFTPEDRAAYRPETEMGLALGQGSAPDERWHLRKSGERFWAQGEMMPLKSEDGTVQGFLKILRDRTRQRNEAAERDASALRFRSLVEVSPQVVWFGDAAGAITYCNAYWYDYTGLAAGETSEASWLGAIHPDHRERVRAAWLAAARSETHYEVEFPLRRADGEYRWFLSRGQPVRDGDGRLLSWIGISLDIHGRRQTEEDLRKTQDLLRLAAEATSIGIFDYNLVTGELGWDTRVRALFGLSPDAPVSYATFLAGLHPEDRAGADAAVQVALDPAGSGHFDIEYRTLGLEDGIERWIAAKGQAIVEQGRTVRFVGTVRDITARRESEQELREAEERYRLAARATNDAIWDWDLGSDHIRWNEAVQTLFGYTADEVGPSGSWWKSHIHPDDRERVKTSIYAVIDGVTEHWSDEYRFLRADGRYADILDRGFVLRNERGRATRMIGAMLDITARKRAEEHQRLLTGELQHRVKNTLALVQAIASQTLRGATDINEMREAFASRLISLGRAHDILTQASWTAAPIGEVVEGALSVHRNAGPARIRISGPNVLMAAKPALSLALALHELATNAAKYGALSNERGIVDLRWHVVLAGDESRFSLIWSEQGGPPILSAPQHKGFGSRLIERSFAAEVGGEVKLTYAPTGLVCRLEASLAAMQEQRSEAAA
ncbi:PAS domain-containing protein (plasmid) [Methylobacterium currus]|uniref:PAS domain-containing protein n=1 Tax=Methylobacterium currus TaxID=2051553 RepID=UPI001E6385AB|nr:PAS domain-containing protein [Methylobacterium currus]UHC20102.1 PAS domain-containing protein [Methylobacterium currus]